jgi:hypothetical protein
MTSCIRVLGSNITERPLHNLLREPNTALHGARNPHVLKYSSTFRLLRSVRLVFGSLATVVCRGLTDGERVRC